MAQKGLSFLDNRAGVGDDEFDQTDSWRSPRVVREVVEKQARDAIAVEQGLKRLDLFGFDAALSEQNDGLPGTCLRILAQEKKNFGKKAVIEVRIGLELNGRV